MPICYTVFSYNIFYQQYDGVSIGSSLPRVLANIILKEFKVVVAPLIESGILKFYFGYVDDMLVLVKEDQINKILKGFILFGNNLWFTVDKFKNEDIHSLDIKIVNDNEYIIYINDASSGLYVNYISCEPCHTKKLHELKHCMTELVQYIVTKICSSNK